MKIERWLLLFLFFFILVKSVAFVNVAHTSPTTWVRVVPTTITADPGESFTVDIVVEDVPDLYTWQVRLEWNATLLDYKNITEGPFVKENTPSPEGTFFVVSVEQDQTGMDYVFPGCSTLGDFYGVSGSGVLATVEFEVEGQGDTPLHIYDVKLRDHSGYPLQPNDGAPDYYFTNLKDGRFINVGVPVALFTFDVSHPTVNETIEFDASASYDTTEDGNITLYSWDFGDQTQLNETNPIVTHAYTSSGTFTVSLTVYDDINLTDTKTAQLTIKFAHDVAVLEVHPVKSEVPAGEKVSIVVVVSNEGLGIETFEVTVYYDSTSVGPAQTVINLEPGENQTLSFVWDTTDILKGTYRIKAVVSAVEDEVEAAQVNNTKLAGTVTISEASVVFPWEIVAVVVAVAVAAAGFLLWRRRGS